MPATRAISAGNHHLVRFLASFTAIALIAGNVLVHAQNSAATEVPPLKLTIFSDKISSSYAITRTILITSSNQFSGVLPSGFRTQLNETDKKLTLLSQDHAGSISWKIVESPDGQPLEIPIEELRAQALARQAGARIVSQSTVATCGKSGPIFELEWWTVSKTKMTMRVAFIPFAGGQLEFQALAPASRIRDFDGPLNQLLISIRTSPVGAKLATQTISANL